MQKVGIVGRMSSDQAGCDVQAKTVVLTHFSGRYNSGEESASAVDADDEDEQQRSLLMLKAEAEGGLRQGRRNHQENNTNTTSPAGRPPVTVACAFDGFTWRLPREPVAQGAGVKQGEGLLDDAGSLVWEDEEWVKQRSLVEAKTRPRGPRR